MDTDGVTGGSVVITVGWETGGDEGGSTGTAADTDGMDGMARWHFWELSRDPAGR